MVLACKSDLERQVDPELILELITRNDSGLVEASKESKGGKDKMRRSFEWLIIAILRERRGYSFLGDHVRVNVCMAGCNDQDPNYRNPASPDNLGPLPPWENPRMPRPSTESSRVVTPTTPSSMTSIRTVVHTQSQVIPSRLQQASTMPSIPSSRSPSAPTSPTRARSTSDLHEKWKNQGQPFDGNRSGRNSILTLGIGGSVSSDQLNTSATVVGEAEEEISNSIEPSEPKQS